MFTFILHSLYGQFCPNKNVFCYLKRNTGRWRGKRWRRKLSHRGLQWRTSPDREPRGQKKRISEEAAFCDVSIMKMNCDFIILMLFLVVFWVCLFVCFLGWWNITRAMLLWVSTLRILWLQLTQTGMVKPGIHVIRLKQ